MLNSYLSKMLLKKLAYILLVVLFITDLFYSFVQFKSEPIDGDLAGLVVPAKDIQITLDNPFGIEVLKNKTKYPNPNRFFSHWAIYKYFNTTPFFIQKFTSPINSLYISAAIFKIIIHLILILFLAFYAYKLFNLNFFLSACILTPLFQTNGYSTYMGIIDHSISYSFFYALPTIFVLLQFVPLLYTSKLNLKQTYLFGLLFSPIAVITNLSGPLNTGIVIIVSSIIMLHSYKQNKKEIGKQLVFIIPTCALALYSLYLGKYNLNNIVSPINLTEAYLKIPQGMYYQFTQKIGFPILFSLIIINSYILHRFSKDKFIYFLKITGLFIIIYIMLLPLGGYRSYREYILRYDTTIPISLALFFLFSTSSLLLISLITDVKQKIYVTLIISVALIFTIADKPKFTKNECEKIALNKLSKTTQTSIKLNTNCNVLSWDKITHPKKSELNSELLLLLNVTDKKVLYTN